MRLRGKRPAAFVPYVRIYHQVLTVFREINVMSEVNLVVQGSAFKISDCTTMDRRWPEPFLTPYTFQKCAGTPGSAVLPDIAQSSYTSMAEAPFFFMYPSQVFMTDVT